MSFEAGPHDPQPMPLHISTTPDVLAVLPPNAAEKLRALRQRSSDLNRLIPASEDRLAASNARVGAEQRLQRLKGHPFQRGGGFNLKPDDVRVVEQQRLIDRLTAELARINSIYETRSAAWTAASHVLSNVERWLKAGFGGATLEDFAGSPPKRAKGESLTDAIERHRRRGRELKADLNKISSSPLPSAYCKQRMRAQIEQLAQRGAPSVARLIEHDGPVEFPTQMLTIPVRYTEGASATVEVPDMAGISAWLHRDTLLSALDRLITDEADDKAALSHAEREKREAEVSADLLATERDECALVWQAQAQNLPAEHRADCSPLALLGVELVAAAPVNPSPGTTKGMSWAR